MTPLAPNPVADGSLTSGEDYAKAILNILEDFAAEKGRLESAQRAVINIVEDSSTEKLSLEGTQRAVLNILEDFTIEKGRLEGAQRAVLNIVEDFSVEKVRLEETQRAMLNLLEDFDRERVKTEAARRELQQSNAQLRDEMQERRKVEEQVKRSLHEKEALLKEIHHRVKNNLQIIQSMLNLQISHLKDERAIALFRESQNRVYSMALIHEKLYQSESLARIDFSEYVRSLVNYLFSSYGASGRVIRPKIVVEGVSLDVDATIPCALIINELVSNSLKHAFPFPRSPEEPGEIRIGLSPEGHGFLLRVGDNGVGLPEGFAIETSGSLGLKLVAALAKQLNGRIEVGRRGGAEFAISFMLRGREGGGRAEREDPDR